MMLHFSSSLTAVLFLGMFVCSYTEKHFALCFLVAVPLDALLLFLLIASPLCVEQLLMMLASSG